MLACQCNGLQPTHWRAGVIVNSVTIIIIKEKEMTEKEILDLVKKEVEAFNEGFYFTSYSKEIEDRLGLLLVKLGQLRLPLRVISDIESSFEKITFRPLQRAGSHQFFCQEYIIPLVEECTSSLRENAIYK